MLDLPLRNDTSTDEACPYCKKFNHTLKQCWVKKSDEHLKDEVEELIPSLKKIYKAQHDLLQQKERLTMDQEKLMSLIQALDMLLQDHLTDEKLQQRSPSDHKLHANKRRLQIVRINELFAILKALELEYWYVYHHAPPQKNYRFG